MELTKALRKAITTYGLKKGKTGRLLAVEVDAFMAGWNARMAWDRRKRSTPDSYYNLSHIPRKYL